MRNAARSPSGTARRTETQSSVSSRTSSTRSGWKRDKPWHLLRGAAAADRPRGDTPSRTGAAGRPAPVPRPRSGPRRQPDRQDREDLAVEQSAQRELVRLARVLEPLLVAHAGDARPHQRRRLVHEHPLGVVRQPRRVAAATPGPALLGLERDLAPRQAQVEHRVAGAAATEVAAGPRLGAFRAVAAPAEPARGTAPRRARPPRGGGRADRRLCRLARVITTSSHRAEAGRRRARPSPCPATATPVATPLAVRIAVLGVPVAVEPQRGLAQPVAASGTRPSAGSSCAATSSANRPPLAISSR